MDGEAWWAAVHGVAQSRTRLKRLSSSSKNEIKDKYKDSTNPAQQNPRLLKLPIVLSSSLPLQIFFHVTIFSIHVSKCLPFTMNVSVIHVKEMLTIK